MYRKAAFTCPILLLAVYLLLFFSQLLGADSLAYRGSYSLSLVILQFVIFLIPAFVYCRLKGTGYALKLNLRPVGPLFIGVTLLSVLTMISGAWLIRLGQIYLVTGGKEIALTFAQSVPEAAGVGSVLSIGLVFCLVPAVCEEFVFRSVIFCGYLEENYGGAAIALLTSATFAMLHFDKNQFFLLFWNGLVLFLLTYVSESAIPAVIAHFLYNIYSVFGERYVLMMMRSTYSVGLLLLIAAVLFLVFLAGFLGQCEKILLEYGSLDRPTPAYVTQRKALYPTRSDRALHDLGAFLSVPLLLCVIFYVLVLLFS